jgi:hypothetical protein
MVRIEPLVLGAAMANQLDVILAEYQRAIDERKMYVDIRFKLLAFVPTVTAVGVTVAKDFPSVRLVVAVIGLVTTFSVVVYEMRNTQLHDLASHTVNMIRQWLGFDNAVLPYRKERHKLLGKLFVQHDVAIALIYGACIAAWSGLFLVSLGSFLLQDYAWIDGHFERQVAREVAQWLAILASVGLGVWLSRFVLSRNAADAQDLRQLTTVFKEKLDALDGVKGQRSY